MMGDEIRLPTTDAPVTRRASGGLYVHYCEHTGCKEWGGWGYSRNRQDTRWFCYEHREEGEAYLGR